MASENKLYAIVRIRGAVNSRGTIHDTMEILKLKKVSNCMIYPDSEPIKGMLKKSSTYLTWGELTQEMLVKLLLKRGRLEGDKKLDEKKAKEVAEKILKNKSAKDAGVKMPLRLAPPSKGYKTVKAPFPKGDAGYRGEKINDLLERMM